MCVGGHCSAESFAAAAGALIGRVNSKPWYENTASSYRAPPSSENKVLTLVSTSTWCILYRTRHIVSRIRIRISRRISLLELKLGETQIQTAMCHSRHVSGTNPIISEVQFSILSTQSWKHAPVFPVATARTIAWEQRSLGGRVAHIFASKPVYKSCWSDCFVLPFCHGGCLHLCLAVFFPKKVNRLSPAYKSRHQRLPPPWGENKCPGLYSIFGSAISILIRLNEPQEQQTRLVSTENDFSGEQSIMTLIDFI